MEEREVAEGIDFVDDARVPGAALSRRSVERLIGGLESGPVGNFPSLETKSCRSRKSPVTLRETCCTVVTAASPSPENRYLPEAAFSWITDAMRRRGGDDGCEFRR